MRRDGQSVTAQIYAPCVALSIENQSRLSHDGLLWRRFQQVNLC